MINRSQLLSDLQALLRKLEADLLARTAAAEVPEVGETLRAEYDQAKNADRTAQSYEQWQADFVTQMAVAWVLNTVFIRFLEDNQLIDAPLLSGSGDRLQQARDEHELYFRQHPTETDREYLLHGFKRLAKLSGVAEIFGAQNLVWALPNWLSGDAAGELLRFFQRLDSGTGQLVHDFTDPAWDTRFLGDLYQDLSESARKQYALLQTPIFVEEFILDRTLDPAIAEFGLDGLRMIDPACGSGHFLLGAFARILDKWQRKEPGTNVRALAQRALDAVHGVDVNPYAVAIARFRLLLAALQAEGLTKLKYAPSFEFNLACGDSLLHGAGSLLELNPHYSRSEDAQALSRILQPGRYHAVVANPPYIVPKDKALNEAYRRRYAACYRQYSLAVPFMERIFDLAVDRGFTGQITANSFMKREFGKKLIEEFFPTVDLTHVIDTSGAYIPGHGTPTVILFGRNRQPIASTIRTVMGIRGEPSTPDDPAQGLVWSAISKQIDIEGSQSEFVSVANSLREQFHKHPWSIGGGGASDLKEQLEQSAEVRLEDVIDTICSLCITRADDAYIMPLGVLPRQRIKREHQLVMVIGEQVRDWGIYYPDSVLFPYDQNLNPVLETEGLEVHRFLWSFREILWRRRELGGDHRELNRTWWEWNRFLSHRFINPKSIAFAEVATHNHFVLDHGRKVFKQTAPVIKLTANSTEENYLALLGLLNSSTACFWLKQSCHQKQMMGGDGIRIESKAKVPYAFNGTQVGRLAIPQAWLKGDLRQRLLDLTREMDRISEEWSNLTATRVIQDNLFSVDAIREQWNVLQKQRKTIRSRQIFLQEEIDFTVYRMFDLVSDDLLSDLTDWSDSIVTEGDRPFCIVDGENEEGFPVPSDVPKEWTNDITQLWRKRIKAIQENRDLRLIESSMYKRRWIGRQGLFNHLRTDNELGDAAKEWLVNRLESYFDFDGRMEDPHPPTPSPQGEGEPEPRSPSEPPSPQGEGGRGVRAKIFDPDNIGIIISINKLAQIANQDPEFIQVAALYRDSDSFDVLKLVTELVEAESVPLLPILRYKATGLRKRQEWERTWALQRQEDAIDARTQLPKEHPDYLDLLAANNLKQQTIGTIPVPPKYTSADFLSSHYWRLRGKLDVPKERWVSFPYCEGIDGLLPIAWAGYDHLQLALAISAYYVDVQERLGGRDDPRLIPLLGCLLELLPWLKQWHNHLHPHYGLNMGDYFEGFITDETRQMDKTLDQIRAWEPPKRTTRRRR